MVKTTRKLIIEVIVVMMGRQILGKLSFFRIFAFSVNKFIDLFMFSENRPQVRMPEHRYMLYPKSCEMVGILDFITCEKTNVYTSIVDNGCNMDHVAPSKEF
jgi:hypothetical protein